MGSLVKDALLQVLFSPDRFSSIALSCGLRRYQLAPVRAIVDSVLNQRGHSFVVMFARQAGKNQISAVLEAYLLCLFQRVGGQIVKAAPSEKQWQISQSRLWSLVRRSRLVCGAGKGGHKVFVGNAVASFLSGHPGASSVGHTASVLLECDETQDQDPDVWIKNFIPMGASTNVTTVYWGTAWSAYDLLGRMRRVVDPERLFLVPWPDVADEVPAYRSHVEKQQAAMGADHPLFLSQYCLEEVDSHAGMFPEELCFLMRGQHDVHSGPVDGEIYYMTIDVGGEAHEGEDVAETGRDSTAVTVFSRRWVEFGSIWQVVARYRFTGEKPDAVSLRVVEVWKPVQIVVDATGIGAGVASILAAHHPNVIPFVFNQASKSRLGWDFIGLCRQGRFLDHAEDGSANQRLFWHEVESAQLEVLPGPGRLCRWSVPESAGHDDLLISAALVAELDKAAVAPYQQSQVSEAEDVLQEMDGGGF